MTIEEFQEWLEENRELVLKELIKEVKVPLTDIKFEAKTGYSGSIIGLYDYTKIATGIVQVDDEMKIGFMIQGGPSWDSIYELFSEDIKKALDELNPYEDYEHVRSTNFRIMARESSPGKGYKTYSCRFNDGEWILTLKGEI